MNNLIFEMKNIVEKSKKENLVLDNIRILLKEFLQYFVLDFIYNSKFKFLIFYGGSCLRILYDLDRMSEDLDFEAAKRNNIDDLENELKDYFGKSLKLSSKTNINQEGNIKRIFLNFPVMHEIGASDHKDEILKIKLEIKIIDKEYLKTIYTPTSKYGKSFVIRHYDLPTLMASKIGAILQRTEKGFHVGRLSEKISFKGRDYYDLLWYMDKRIMPDKKALEVNGVKENLSNIFDLINSQIAKINTEGIKKDIMPLFANQNYVDNWISSFRETFSRFRKRYKTKKILIRQKK